MSKAKYLGLTANQLAKIASELQAENEKLEVENAKLRELVKDIDEVADPFLWEFIGRRMQELGVGE